MLVETESYDTLRFPVWSALSVLKIEAFSGTPASSLASAQLNLFSGKVSPRNVTV